MTQTNAAAFLELVDARRGHFRLESGHHSELWLDLDPLFANTSRIAPFASALADLIQPHGVSAVCGPLIGGAFLAQLVARELGLEFYFTERRTPERERGLYETRYVLPNAFAPLLEGRRVAIVDDVMSAGSALRGTYAELAKVGAQTAVAGALLVLGSRGADFFTERGVTVAAVARHPFELWMPDGCPLCAANVPLEDIAIT